MEVSQQGHLDLCGQGHVVFNCVQGPQSQVEYAHGVPGQKGRGLVGGVRGRGDRWMGLIHGQWTELSRICMEIMRC